MRAKRAVLALLVSLMSLLLQSESASADQYRSALKKYWKQFFKGEGITPLFYGSTIHGPKTVWAKSDKSLDFFASGEELLPSAYVPVMMSRISLGDRKRDSKTSASIALQLAGLNKIEDAKLNAAASGDYKWEVRLRDPELHFLALRDVNRCVKNVSGSVRADYFTDLAEVNGKLLVITKAVYVKSFEVSVKSSTGVSLDADVNLGTTLTDLGFAFSKSTNSATLISGEGMYLAAGFRELNRQGGAVGAGDAPPPEQVIAISDLSDDDFPFEVPSPTPSAEGVRVPLAVN